MREILADLVAEQQGLDQFLQRIDFRKWGQKTRVPRWTIRDHVSHLAAAEEIAYDAIAGDGKRLAELSKVYQSADDFGDEGLQHGQDMRVQQVIEWWRETRATVVDALSKMRGSEPIPWLDGEVTAEALASMRMADTWAHGLDLHDAVEADPESSLRLRHIAALAHDLLPQAFADAGADYEDVRVELRAPQYQKWVYGPEGSEQLIRGDAGEFCMVAVGRLDPAATGIEVEGDVAERAMELVRTYP